MTRFRLKWLAAIGLVWLCTAVQADPPAPGPNGGWPPLPPRPEPQLAKGPRIWFSYSLSPTFTQNFSVAAVVEMVGDAAMTTRKAVGANGAEVTASFVEFDVRVVEGVGVEAGEVRHCYAPGQNTGTLPSDAKRFLLLGWGNGGGTSLAVPLTTVSVSHRVVVDRKSLFVGVFIPTAQQHVAARGDVFERTYLSLARALAAGIDKAPLRHVTGQLAALNSKLSTEMIGGIYADEWLGKNVGYVLKDAQKPRPLDKLRLGGLVTSWLSPTMTRDFVHGLPALLKEVRRDDGAGGMSYFDGRFLKELNLFGGLGPDEVVDFSMANPDLKFMMLDPRMGIPSLESQKRMLSLLDDPDQNVRMYAYGTFAGWYGETDMLLRSRITWSAAENRMVIPNEAAMHEYWYKRIGAPPKP